MRPDVKVVIVGAGIHGLSCALALRERGLRSIQIVTKESLLETTSAVAGGLIDPFFVGGDPERINRWFCASRARLAKQLADPAWHVHRTFVRSLHREALPPRPSWAAQVDGFSAQPVSRPPFRFEWTYVTEVVETPRHLRELAHRLQQLGIEIHEREVTSLSALASEADLIVNCAGAFARQLGDESVRPGRGQVVLLERTAQTPAEVLLDDETITYIIPRGSEIVVGGTFEPGEWSRAPRLEVADEILGRAYTLLPALAQARVIGHCVGLRPLRPTPRLEIETVIVDDRRALLAHCYGTGGAGVSLAYGMAEELAAEVAAALELSA